MRPKTRAFSRRGNALRSLTFLAVLIFVMPVLLSPQVREIRVTDDVGRALVLPAAPRRIISLAPNITEILFRLGAGDRIVGVTRYCDYPPETRMIEKVGGILDPDVERIKSLRPDVVIAFRGNPLDVLRKLEEIGVPLFILDIKNELSAVPHLVERIGAAIGRAAAAARLNAELTAKSAAVTSALEKARTKPRIFLSLEGLGLWTFGRDSYFNDLLGRAKAVSVTGTIEKRWFEYGRETLIQDDPDAIVILAKSEADFRRAADWFRGQPVIRNLTAVRNGRMLFLDQNSASRFGPRLFDALSDLARLLHPDCY